jgi:DNA-binding CsgD family transcriptional regulator
VAVLDERAGPLLALLYATPGDPHAASRFVRALCSAISSDVRALGLARATADPSGMLVAFSPDGWRAEVVVDLAVPTASGEPSIEGLPVGAVFEIPGGDAHFGESPLFKNLLEPFGVQPGPGLGMVQARDEARVTLALLLLPADPSWAPSPHDRELLESLAPHLLQSLRLHTRLTDASAGADALVAAFDHLALGVVLIDAHDRLTFANQSAADILKIEPGLARGGAHARVRKPISLLIANLQESASQIYRHPRDGRPLQIFATLLAWPDHFAEARARFHRAIFIGDPRNRTGDPVDILSELYGLTAGEARLAVMLLSDRSLEQAAQQLGIAVSTARSHLKSLFAKTGTNRQASLMRLLISGPGQLRAHTPDVDLPRRRRRRSKP